MAASGSSRKLRFQTYGEDGKPASATEVKLYVTPPAGPEAGAVVAADGTGRYENTLLFDSDGLWSWRWETTNPGPAVARIEADAVLIGGSRAAPAAPWCSISDVIRTPALKKLGENNELDLDDVGRQCIAATEWLHSRTWRRFRGLRSVELRPCCQCARISPYALAGLLWPLMAYSSGDSQPVYDGPASCGCSILHELTLPSDTQTVVGVTIDGAPFTDYRVDGRRLLRTDDEPWPCCQRIDRVSTEDDTFAVNVVVGGEMFEVARTAAAELASEFYLAIADPASCRIPTRVNSVTRQGVVYTRVDTTTLAKDRMLGLRATDIFLSEFGQVRKRMAMASPDVAPLDRRIG